MWLTTPDYLRLIFHNLSVVFLYSTVVVIVPRDCYSRSSYVMLLKLVQADIPVNSVSNF